MPRKFRMLRKILTSNDEIFDALAEYEKIISHPTKGVCEDFEHMFLDARARNETELMKDQLIFIISAGNCNYYCRSGLEVKSRDALRFGKAYIKKYGRTFGLVINEEHPLRNYICLPTKKHGLIDYNNITWKITREFDPSFIEVRDRWAHFRD